MTIHEDNARRKRELMLEMEKAMMSNDDRYGRSISTGTVKKVATLENLFRFYQNCLHVFSLESHYHYATDIKEDDLHNFVTKGDLETIEKVSAWVKVTKEQIDSMFD